MDEYLSAAAQQLHISQNSIELVKILNKALNATNAEQFYYDIALVVRTPDSFDNRDNLPHYTETPAPDKKLKSSIAAAHNNRLRPCRHVRGP